MKAAILTEIDKPLKIEYIELTDLKIGQVLVKNIKKSPSRLGVGRSENYENSVPSNHFSTNQMPKTCRTANKTKQPETTTIRKSEYLRIHNYFFLFK